MQGFNSRALPGPGSVARWRDQRENATDTSILPLVRNSSIDTSSPCRRTIRSTVA